MGRPAWHLEWRWHLRIARIVLCILAGACSTASTAIPGATACRSGAIAAVGPGLAPVISWNPDCTIGYLSVLDSTFQPTWIVVDSGSTGPLNGLRSGITYGVVPPGGRLLGPSAGPLSVGARYVLLLRVEAISGPGKLVDTATFTP